MSLAQSSFIFISAKALSFALSPLDNNAVSVSCSASTRGASLTRVAVPVFVGGATKFLEGQVGKGRRAINPNYPATPRVTHAVSQSHVALRHRF